jgi:cell division transport system permease protein
MIGISGSLVAILTCAGVYKFTMNKLYSSAPFLPLAAGNNIVIDLCFVLIILGALVGSVGSVISIRKFLHV